MMVKMDYFSDDNIVDLFNSLLPDNYFIHRTGFTDLRSSLFGEPEYSIPVIFCRKHKGVMRRIDGDINVSVCFNELSWMRLNVDLLQWEGESDAVCIDVKFNEFRDFDELKRAVSYDAKCLSKGCPTVTMKVKDVEYEE